MAVPDKKYTVDEFLKFTENNSELFELIDGEIIAMSSPSTIHQTIVTEISAEIRNYIKTNNGKCKSFVAPYDVRLKNSIVIPDISVICDKSKIDDKRCNGSPDWIVEVVSSNWKDDYIRKLALYEENGVREYWIVDPEKEKVFVYFFENKNVTGFYDFSQTITVNIYRDNPVQLKINIAELIK